MQTPQNSSLVAPSASTPWETSSGTPAASTAVPIGTSGRFIRMSTAGTLVPARRLWTRRRELRGRLLRVQRDLDQINDEDWLFDFFSECERRRVNFGDALRARAGRLEKRKAALVIESSKIEIELRGMLPSLPGQSAPVMTIRHGPLVAAKLADPGSHPTLTIKETQQVFTGKSRSTLYRWLDAGWLERASLGRRPGERGSCLILTKSVKNALEHGLN
jgi:hypothetical protein